MEQPQIQRGVTAQLFIPFNGVTFQSTVKTYAAKDNSDDATPPETGYRMYQALAITEGEFNDTVFTADELASMVERINASGRVNQIRIVEEHNDSVGALLGRATSLDVKKVNIDGMDLQGVTIDFALFDRLQKQRDAITQLEQAPDLIGLSVAIIGDLIPVEVYQNEVVDIKWTWKGMDLIHVALVTYPACSATEGTIAAVYKTSDGAVFNPAFFTAAPTSEVMEPTKLDQTLGMTSAKATEAGTSVTTSGTFGGNTPNMTAATVTTEAPQTYAAPSPETQTKTLQECLEIAALGQKIEVDLDTGLLLSMSADQRKAYKADLQKIVEKFGTAHPAAKTPASAEKGAEFTGTNEPDYERLGKDFIAGTGTFANFGKKLGGN